MRIGTLLVLLALAASLAGCSAAKAARKTGAEPDAVVACTTVPCLQAHASAELLEQRDLADGDRFYRFRYQRRQGSILRAIGYGVVGVYTLGISEIVTNPAENAIQNDRMFVVDVVCTPRDGGRPADHAEHCHTMTVTEPGRDTVVVREQASTGG